MQEEVKLTSWSLRTINLEGNQSSIMKLRENMQKICYQVTPNLIKQGK